MSRVVVGVGWGWGLVGRCIVPDLLWHGISVYTMKDVGPFIYESILPWLYILTLSSKTIEFFLVTDENAAHKSICLLYTSDAADDMQCVDLGGRRIIKKGSVVSLS